MPLRRTLALSLALTTAAMAGELPSAKILERYKQMLVASPVEGTALDRLWKAYADAGQTAELIHGYETDKTFSGWMILGYLRQRADQPDQAAAAFSAAAEMDSPNALPWLALGRLRVTQAHHADAAIAFEKASKLLSGDAAKSAEVLVLLGTEQLAAGNTTGAVEAWEKTVTLDPANLDLRRKLAGAYTRNGLPDRALPHLEFLVSNAPVEERAQALEEIARIHQAGGRIDEAREALEKAIALTAPENWLRGELQNRLIRLYERAHRISELEERWKKQASENPRDLGACLQLIVLYERLGDDAQQRVWREKLVALAPKNATYRLALARLLVRMDDLNAGVPLYDQLLTEQPRNADLVFERANLELRRNAPEAARRRIQDFVSVALADEAIRARALDFYERNHFQDLEEKALSASAQTGGDDAVIALADFYFQQHREDEAKRQLARLVRAEDPVETRTAATLRVAQIYKGNNLLTAAIETAENAAQLAANSPTEREIRLFLGELHDMTGQHDAALQDYEAAARASRTDAEIAEADRKRFDALRQTRVTPESFGGKVEMTLPLPSGEPAEPTDPKIGAIVRELTAEAEATPSASAWLRVAQWNLWLRDFRGACESANKALVADPKSTEAHEFLLKLTSTEPGAPLAVWHLERLAELDPANRVDYQRREVQLKLQSGRAEEALGLLEDLARLNPGNTEVLNDLALVQQRLEHWDDALATWQRLYATAGGKRKRDTLTSLLHAYEHLNQPRSAAELLLREVESRQDAREQMEMFQELLAHCQRHGLLPWLEEKWEARRKRDPENSFTEVAYGRLLQAKGDRAGAFEVLSNAALEAPNPADSLPALAREAEELHRLDVAVDLQERLVRIAPENSPEGLERLADLQEKTFATEIADRTWQKAVTRFPRDAAAAMLAVEFYFRSGDPDAALPLLRKVREIEPHNVNALLKLAALDEELGNLSEAKDCLEHVLQESASRKTNENVRFPGMKSEDATHLQTAYLSTVRQRGGRATAETMRALRGFWTPGSVDSKGESDARLDAIRRLAHLIKASDDTEAQQKWIARWRHEAESGQTTDVLWALFYAGAGEATLDVLDTMLRHEPDNEQTKQAFIWLGLQTHQYARLGAWMRDPARTTMERDFLVIALGQYLDSNPGRVSLELVDGLFPEGARARLWQVAEAFGSRGQFEAAAHLGDRAFTQPDPQRPLMGLELAKWHLCLGDAPGARRILQQIALEKAESFESPVFSAMHDEWLLSPESERPAFVQQLEHGIDMRGQPVHGTLTHLLLHGLSGNETAARDDIRVLLRMRVMERGASDENVAPAVRFWNFVLVTGMQLETWKMHALAIELWEKALADRALLRLEGEAAQEVAKDIRARLFALKLAHAEKFSLNDVLSAYGSAAQGDGAIALGEALENLGAGVRAIEFYRALWERDPANPQIVRNLLAACRNAGDMETAESVLRSCLSQQFVQANESLSRELVMQLANLLEKRGAVDEAIRTLRGADVPGHYDARIPAALAELQERSGLTRDAEATWRRVIAMEPSHVYARIALASILQRAGKLPAALDQLEKAAGNESFAKQAEVLFAMGRSDDAVAMVERIPIGTQAPAVQTLAGLMLRHGDRQQARMLLREAMNRITDPITLMQIEQQLIETCNLPADRAFASRELHKLRRLAEGDPARLGLYFSYVEMHATELGAEDSAPREMAAAWADGTGLLSAGAVLLAWHLDHHASAADAVLDRLLARSDLDESWLKVLDSSLVAANRLELAARVRERLVALNPMDDDRIITWVKTLADLGERSEALAALTKWSARAPLQDDFAGKVAQVYVDLGAENLAEPLFAQAIRGDPFARNFQVRLDAARLFLSHNSINEAQKLLAVAYRNPRNHDYSPLVQYLALRPEEIDVRLTAFHFPQKIATESRRAVLTKLASSSEPAGALRFAEAHPEILDAGTAALLRGAAGKTGEFERMVRLLENLSRQAPGGAISTELARVLADWADSDLRANDEASALAHLERARIAQPLWFEAVRKLAAIYKRSGEHAKAKAVLDQFLAMASNPKDRSQAEQLLLELEPR